MSHVCSIQIRAVSFQDYCDLLLTVFLPFMSSVCSIPLQVTYRNFLGSELGELGECKKVGCGDSEGIVCVGKHELCLG